jgi:hypothetical protein
MPARCAHARRRIARPDNVEVYQIVDKSIGKWAIAVEGKNPAERERQGKGRRRHY